MARTLRTVERRLGVDPDRIITYYFLCPECWKAYHPSQLLKLQSPCCTADDCSGTLYTSKRTSSSTDKRTPCKIMPTVSIIEALEHILMRPGKWDELHAWKTDEDKSEPNPLPVTRDEWLQNLNHEKPLRDVSDGWVWRSIPARLERTWDPIRRVVNDEHTTQLYQQHVSLECGLVLQINIDWLEPSVCPLSILEADNITQGSGRINDAATRLARCGVQSQIYHVRSVS